MLSPNLHVVTCRLLLQELQRGPAANENDLYMERYMLEPKRRNAHRTTLNPEITHLRHTECVQRALAKCALEHGCQQLHHLAPTKAYAVGFLYDPDVGQFRANFPNKGQLVGQDGVDTAPFEAYMATTADAKPESFWKQVVMHACDPTVHDNPCPMESALVNLRFTKCKVHPAFTLAASQSQCCNLSKAATCVEVAPHPGLDWPHDSGVALVLWFGMLSQWSERTSRHSHVERFACVYWPSTQSQVTMGGTKVFTAEFAKDPPQDQCFAVGLSKLLGPFIVLNPNPDNRRGFAHTFRFFSTPGKRGVL
jgi:hypothetical protein